MPRKKKTETAPAEEAAVKTPVQEAAPVQEPEPVKAPVQKPVSRGNGTVAVALNHHLDLKFMLPGGRAVVLKGSASHLRGREKGVLPVGAYGITVIPEADWEYISKKYAGMAVFKSGRCFARPAQSDAMAMAEERKELRHGFEAADPERGATRPASSKEV